MQANSQLIHHNQATIPEQVLRRSPSFVKREARASVTEFPSWIGNPESEAPASRNGKLELP